MKTTSENREKEYVDPILIKEGFFKNEEDYFQTMDKMFKGLAEAAKNGTIQKRGKRSRRSSVKKS